MASEIITGISSSSNLERKMHLKGTVVKTNKAGAIIDIGVVFNFCDILGGLHLSQRLSSGGIIYV